MFGCLRTVAFVVFFPVTVPIWLIRRGGWNVAWAVLFVLALSVAIGTIPTPDERAEADARATLIASFPTSTPTPTATPTPTLTPTDMPIATVAPIVTVVTPTAQPTATSTVAPTLTPTPNLLIAYRDEITPILAGLIAATDRLQVLFGNPQFNDNAWIIETGAHLGIVRAVAVEASRIVPPAQIAIAHNTLVNALNLCSDAALLLAQGIDDKDAATVNRGTATWLDCMAKVDDANRQMESAIVPR